jgi:hypothetical protein
MGGARDQGDDAPARPPQDVVPDHGPAAREVADHPRRRAGSSAPSAVEL